MSPEAERIFFRLLGERIRRFRAARGWSQADLEESGVSLRHLQFIEAGRPIRLVTALRIASAFEIDVSKLLSGLSSEAESLSTMRASEREAKFEPRPRGRPKGRRRVRERT